MASLREIGSLAAGATGDIGDAPDGKSIEQRSDGGFVGPEKRVVLVVVRRRPDRVALAHGDVADVDQRRLVVNGVNDAPHLGEPCLDEAAAQVIAGPVAEECDAFESEQPGGVLRVEAH